jgi:hypothetical protein
MEADNENILNVFDLIETGMHAKKSSHVKNYEDTLEKCFSTSKNLNMIENKFVHLWNISQNAHIDMFPNQTNFDPQIEISEENKKNIVMTGPYVRSCVYSDKTNIRNEIYLHKLCDSPWNSLLDVSKYEEKKTEYVYNDKEKQICLVKKKYRSPSHVILQHEYIKRCGWYDGSLYVSSMFLIEYQQHISLLNENFKDPIIGLPYDPLCVYKKINKNTSHPIKIIEHVDCDGLIQLSKKHTDKLYNSKTCMELCLDKFIKEEHPILLNQLRYMILHLSSNEFRRPPSLYAKYINLDVKSPEIYKVMLNCKNKYNYTENITNNINSIDEINNIIFEFIIKSDSLTNFKDYLSYTKTTVTKNLITFIIAHNSHKISKFIIENSLVNDNLIYYLILMSQDIELFKYLKKDFDLDLGMNYLLDILENGKVRSFYFLYERDNTLLNTIFDDNKTILHKINNKGSYIDLINVIMKLKPELINYSDMNKCPPFIHHAKYNSGILEHLIDYEFDYTTVDNKGNTILHYLCINDNIDVLRMYIKKCPELINFPNKSSETPMILACKNNKENMFYTLKGFGGDMNSCDKYGNTPCHYICSNTMCIGMIIENNKNSFGLTPQDYCKISPTHYNFIEVKN